MRIVLVGYRGSGKTTVGRIVAKRLSMDFFDSDEMIESLVGPIDEFVRKNGWRPFRALEEGVVKSLVGRDNFVLSSGGGTFMNLSNVRVMKGKAFFFFLKASPEVIRERIKDGKRPSLTGKGTLEEVEEVLRERLPVYIAISDFVIDTDHLSPEEVASEIVWIVKGRF